MLFGLQNKYLKMLCDNNMALGHLVYTQIFQYIGFD